MAVKETNNGPRLLAECIALIALSTLAIVLRFWSRALLPRKKFGADDWTALTAFPFVIVALALLGLWATHGLGQHNQPLTPLVLKLLISKKIIWNAGITLARISALLFYRRLFAHSFKISFWLGVAANVVWFVLLFFLVMFSCSPTQRQWDRSFSGTCLPELPGQIVSSLTSVVIDLYILVMPMPILWRLQMRKVKKGLIGGILMLGYSVPVISLGRFGTTLKNRKSIDADPNWGFGHQEFWGALEISLSFIGIAIPCIFTMLRRAARHGPCALFNDQEYTEKSDDSARVKLGPSGHKKGSLVGSSARPLDEYSMPPTASDGIARMPHYCTNCGHCCVV
ncbi:MAG: hypothetical protein M1831_006593 [Alyxoria varia]|nr:MAG: hypothetical protein M1831_006593 [Alyxoria varia]